MLACCIKCPHWAHTDAVNLLVLSNPSTETKRFLEEPKKKTKTKEILTWKKLEAEIVGFFAGKMTEAIKYQNSC